MYLFTAASVCWFSFVTSQPSFLNAGVFFFFQFPCVPSTETDAFVVGFYILFVSVSDAGFAQDSTKEMNIRSVLNRTSFESDGSSHSVQTGSEAHPTFCPVGTGGSFLGVKLTTHLILVSLLRMLGVVPPLHRYVFMAWCLVKHKRKFYLFQVLSVNIQNEVWNRRQNTLFCS
jgi:hypothetical protein